MGIRREKVERSVDEEEEERGQATPPTKEKEKDKNLTPLSPIDMLTTTIQTHAQKKTRQHQASNKFVVVTDPITSLQSPQDGMVTFVAWFGFVDA